jgi:hypothetical protein
MPMQYVSSMRESSGWFLVPFAALVGCASHRVTLASPGSPAVEGVVAVATGIRPDGTEGAIAFAALYGQGQAPPEDERWEWLDPIDAVGDCGLRQASVVERGPVALPVDMGPVRLVGPWYAIPLERIENMYYAMDDVPVRYGVTYSLLIRDAAISSAVTVPERIELVPALDVRFPRVDTELAWTGTSAGTVQVWIGSGGGPDVWCEVEDDGSFVVPGALLSRLQAGEGHVQIERTVETISGKLRGTGTAMYTAAVVVE